VTEKSQNRRECENGGDFCHEIKIDAIDPAPAPDHQRSNSVWIRQSAAVDMSRDKRRKKSKNRQSGERQDKIETPWCNRTERKKQRQFHAGQRSRRRSLPNHVKARMMKPQRIGRMCAVQIERKCCCPLRCTEEGKQVAGQFLMCNRLPSCSVWVLVGHRVTQPPQRPADADNLAALREAR
jgi:hypothetical protein